MEESGLLVGVSGEERMLAGELTLLSCSSSSVVIGNYVINNYVTIVFTLVLIG